MANIPVYQSKLTPQGSVDPRGLTPRGISGGLDAIGQGLGDVARTQQAIQHDQSVTWASTAASQAELAVRQKINDHINELDPSSPDYPQQIAGIQSWAQDQFDGARNDLISAAPTEDARRMLTQHLTSAEVPLMTSTMAAQSRLSASHAASVVQQGVDANTNLLAADPSDSNLQRIEAQDQQTIGNLRSVSPEVKQKWLDQNKAQYSKVQVATVASQNPYLFLKSIDPNAGYDNKDGVPHAPLTIPNLNADLVKPFSPQKVEDVRALVAQPSKYDKLFQEAGAKYGVDPQALKLRAAVESGLDPKADNGQAKGIMQFTPAMAKSLGIDPNDPAQAIDAAAKYTAQLRGSHPSNVDQAYYGGSDQSKWGPNTQQYAANMAAVRQTLSGGGSEGSGFTPGQVYARNAPYVKPGVQNFYTQLSPTEEKGFRAWVRKNNVSFDPNAKHPDYDMRGFYQALVSGDPKAKNSIDPNDGKIHYPDYWKTPYDATFSRQSKFASESAPDWKGDNLVLPNGRVVYSDTTHSWNPMAPVAPVADPQVKPLSLQQIASAKPGIAGWGQLDLQDRVQIVRGAEAQIGKHLSSERSALTSEIGDAMASYETGQDYPGADSPRFSEANLERVYGTDKGRRLHSELQYGRAVGGFVGQVATMPTAQMQQTIEQLKPEPGVNFAKDERIYNAAVTAAQKVDKQRRKAPVQFAIQHGIGGAQPLDFKDPQKLQASLKNRAQLMDTMTFDYGAPHKVFTEPEVAQLSSALSSMSGTKAVSFLGTVRAGLGDSRAYSVAMSQLAPHDRVAAYAGEIAVKSGHAYIGGNAVPPAQVATTVLDGERILNGKAFAKTDGADQQSTVPTGSKPFKFDDPTFRLMFNDQMGNAFQSPDAQMSAEQQTEMYQAAKAYYVARAYQTGNDPSLIESDRAKNAIEAVAGETWQTRGTTLIAPYGMTADNFQAQWTGRATQALKGAGFDAQAASRILNGNTVSGLKQKPVNWGDGRYAFQVGTGLLRGPNGKPVIVDYSQSYSGPITPPQTLSAGFDAGGRAGLPMMGTK